MTTLTPRLDLLALTPDDFADLQRLAERSDAAAQDAGLDPVLLELVRLHASQLNGCAFCTGLHTVRAQELGASRQRLDALVRWAGSSEFTAPERAALQLAEAVTLLPGGQVPDEDYRSAETHFDQAQLAHLLWTISLINTFNRLAIGSAGVRG